MERKGIKQEIYKVMKSSTETEKEITDDKYLSRDMGLSSMELFILIGDLEEYFGIMIPVDKLKYIQTVGDLCDLIIEKIK